MQSVIIVGGGTGGMAILDLLLDSDYLEVRGVADIDPDAPALRKAAELGIPVAGDAKEFENARPDIVFNVTGSEDVQRSLLASFPNGTVIIPGSVATILFRLLEEKEHFISRLSEEAHKTNTIFNSVEEGMIGIDRKRRITFINKSAARMIGVPAEKAHGKPIYEVIPESGLPRIMESGRTEFNRKLQLGTGISIISSRIPMIDEQGKIFGALAVFKDITEVVSLAEEITNMKEIQTMLEAIIHSSDDAISVVDENGNGLMINPAYTRITGLSKEDVIGKPATADISEGESIHMKALQQRKPFRGVNLKVGPAEREVIVNVAPIIVGVKLKGSVGVIHDMTEIRSLMKELDRARSIIRTLETKYTFSDIIGQSAEIQLSVQQAKLAAETEAIVLLRGESGTGKELFAHAIHSASGRKYNKFIRVNCAALTEELLEMELFGFEEGAFDHIRSGSRKGLFEEADNGSIFLDEIGELSLAAQAKLLRVLEEHEVLRIGGTQPIPVNVRVIAATNINMEKALLDGAFREDLYYRLNRMPIHLPPLKKRKQDIPQIAERLLVKLNQEYGRNIQVITDKALQLLKVYEWPGNVRELENILSRAMIFMQAQDTVMTDRHMPMNMIKSTEDQPGAAIRFGTALPLQEQMDTVEQRILEQTMAECEGNKTKAAKQLQISLRSLYYKLEKFGLS
ncbi:sigma 54-interacting transcriptional regulator [Indiicoccus explosivorum]|uniref:sigma 54-interacting transcriptional regulator n=1 Tax=Indiicoccus explosivorum TaxID=1917864 RepID=UPI000B4546DB|nr:sigma 54-interacting transcriptional regulator [Indiicoccus explosivorum]